MDISRAESYELLCQALDKVDFDKLDWNLCVVIMQSINLLQQYHTAEDLLGRPIIVEEDVPALQYDGLKTSLSLLNNLKRLMDSLLSRAQQNLKITES